MGASEVSPVEIARMAGVGRAAVSNWRRRFADFPAPVGGTAASPRFRLDQVEQWLREHGKLADLPVDERAWQQLRSMRADHDLPAAVFRAGELLAGASAGPAESRLREALTAAAAAAGTSGAYEQLLRRLHEAARLPRVPGPVAELMVALLGDRVSSIYDPACGTGGLLLTALARHPRARLRGDESDPDLRQLASQRATLHAAGHAEIHPGDLRNPPAPVGADAVLCAPPQTDRDWAGDELAYDPRWAYGVPPKGEPELAWVQHALANLRPGGRAVLLLPPAAAARPAGRRIRAALLRRGALQAVVGLPPGAAHPPGVGMHLWVLRQPTSGDRADRVLIADLTAAGPDAGDPAAGGWSPPVATLMTALAATDPPAAPADGHGGSAEPTPDPPEPPAGTSPQQLRLVRVMDLLDDAVDLTPARLLHLDPPPVDPAGVVAGRQHLLSDLARLSEMLPAVAPAPAPAKMPVITVGELVRAGAVTVTTSRAVRDAPEADPSAGATWPPTAAREPAAVDPAGSVDRVAGVPVWRVRDLVAGDGPAGRLSVDQLPPDPPRVAAGDVIAPVIGHRLLARVVTDAEAGAVLGSHIYLLRPDPALLDGWFLAGFLRRGTNTHRASTLGSFQRYDIRRAQVPRVPPDQQHRYGQLFQRLWQFEELLRQVSLHSGELSAMVADGLAAGSLAPAT